LHLQAKSTHGLSQLRHQGRIGGLRILPGVSEAERPILACRGIRLEKREALEAFLGPEDGRKLIGQPLERRALAASD
jgi:hypothetical protein